MQQADIPGLSIALIEKGRPSWVHSFGTVDPKTGQPVTDKTIFNIGSLSKTVFAYAVLKLVDQGKLDLDTPLTHYWPERIVDPQDDPRLDKITARIVLSHRPGFPNWRPDGGKLQIFFNPGERFSYSGEGILYLQHVIEHIEGKSLNDIMQQLVFTPLGMAESSYTWKPELAANMTAGYTPDGRAIGPQHNDNAHANAAGSLNTTTHDYALFLEAVLNRRGLKPATFRQMETPQIAVDPTCTNCTGHTPAKLSTDLFWGLGWGIEQNASGKYLWHWGDNGIYKAYVVADVNHRNAVVFFANSQNGLSIAPTIINEALGGDHPSFRWLNYDTYDSPGMRFTRDVAHNGVQALTTNAAQIQSGVISEAEINSAGYLLLGQKKYDDAIAVFVRNTELHSQSANVYDSLGEAYMTAGKNDLAIRNYEKALEMNPANTGAKNTLTKLRATNPKTEAAH
jgi:CubicO group peptidase (beta-lactamase class C family)